MVASEKNVGLNNGIRKNNLLVNGLYQVFPERLNDPVLRAFAEEYFRNTPDFYSYALKNPYSLAFRAVMNNLAVAIYNVVKQIQLQNSFIDLTKTKQIYRGLSRKRPAPLEIEKNEEVKYKSLAEFLKEMQKELDTFYRLLYGQYYDLIALSFEHQERIQQFLLKDILPQVEDKAVKDQISHYVKEHEKQVEILREEAKDGFIDPVTNQIDMEKMIHHHHKHRHLLHELERKVVHALKHSSAKHDREVLVGKVQEQFRHVHSEDKELKAVHEKMMKEFVKNTDTLREKLIEAIDDINKHHLIMTKDQILIFKDLLEENQIQSHSLQSVEKIANALNQLEKLCDNPDELHLIQMANERIKPILIEKREERVIHDLPPINDPDQVVGQVSEQQKAATKEPDKQINNVVNSSTEANQLVNQNNGIKFDKDTFIENVSDMLDEIKDNPDYPEDLADIVDTYLLLDGEGDNIDEINGLLSSCNDRKEKLSDKAKDTIDNFIEVINHRLNELNPNPSP